LGLTAVLVLSGCVRRRMLIRSQPIGASVFVDDQEIGTTPVAADFTYNGTRKIQLIKDGYETLTVQQAFFPPWYQFPVLEFVSENLSPWEHRDEHFLDFQMQPQQILPADKLVERAQQLRISANQGYTVALPPAALPSQPLAPLPAPASSGSGGAALPLLPPPGQYQ
jgi:hypothetical protein